MLQQLTQKQRLRPIKNKKNKKNRGFAQETEVFFILFYFIFIKKEKEKEKEKKQPFKDCISHSQRKINYDPH